MVLAAAQMDALRTAHSASPQPSPHGAIGEFPGSAPGSAVTTPVMQARSSSAHVRSSSLAGRPRTPAQVVGSNDELDLSGILAQGQRQLELDTAVPRGRVGRFGSLQGRAESPSRVVWEEDWPRQTPSRSSSMRRQASTNSVNVVGGPPTATAPSLNTALAQNWLEQPFPSPISRPRGSALATTSTTSAAVSSLPGSAPTTSNDLASAANHHFQQLASLMGPLCAQSEEVIRLRAEVELWRSEWQRCDRERRRLEGIMSNRNDDGGVGPTFSAVLIDGDGLIFLDEHLRKGFGGGQAAARMLVAALPQLAGGVFGPNSSLTELSKEPVPRDLGTVVVQVFVNKNGLGHALLKAGSVPSWTVYDAFWQGFSSAHDLFSVIDVGHGKEASDAKIRENLKLYMGHRQCSTVFLGASHDNSYANVLSSLETESGISKLVILKGYSDLAPQLKPYASRTVAIPELFRTTRLRDLGPPSQRENGADDGAPTSPKINKRKNLSIKPQQMQPNATSLDDIVVPDDGNEGESPVDVAVMEWETAQGMTPNRNRPGPPRKGSRQLNNVDDEAQVQDYDDGKKRTPHAVGKKYKPTATRASSVPTVRNLKPRPCHTFYLSPWGCKNGDGCEYAHNYKLNEEQTEELARLAKEIICPYVRSKRCHFSEDECVYGHRCPRGERCTFGDTCRFKDLPNGHGELDAVNAAAADPASNGSGGVKADQHVVEAA